MWLTASEKDSWKGSCCFPCFQKCVFEVTCRLESRKIYLFTAQKSRRVHLRIFYCFVSFTGKLNGRCLCQLTREKLATSITYSDLFSFQSYTNGLTLSCLFEKMLKGSSVLVQWVTLSFIFLAHAIKITYNGLKICLVLIAYFSQLLHDRHA